MRITIVTTSYPEMPDDPSGHFVRTEARQLRGRGDEVTVIVPSAKRGAETRDDDGITVRPLYGGAAFGWPGVAARLSRAPFAISDAAEWVYRARNAIVRSSPELILGHWVLPCVWPISAARSPSVSVLGISHGADVRLLLRMPGIVRARLVRRLVRNMTTWRFVSERLRDSLLAGLSVDDQAAVRRIAEIRPSPFELPVVDPAEAWSRRTSLGAQRLVSVVGRLTKGKRVHSALDYAQASGTHVVVVGDGPERRNLERYARARGVSATFVGKTTRAEAALWIKASDELVIGSRAEGLSTVAREAAELGVPVRFL